MQDPTLSFLHLLTHPFTVYLCLSLFRQNHSVSGDRVALCPVSHRCVLLHCQCPLTAGKVLSRDWEASVLLGIGKLGSCSSNFGDLEASAPCNPAPRLGIDTIGIWREESSDCEDNYLSLVCRLDQDPAGLDKGPTSLISRATWDPPPDAPNPHFACSQCPSAIVCPMSM